MGSTTKSSGARLYCVSLEFRSRILEESSELTACRIQRAFENPGYMHMCLMLSACQWAWVTGSMDTVRIPFLYHKASTYQFAREQLCKAETAQSGDTMLAIAALALTEVPSLYVRRRCGTRLMME